MEAFGSLHASADPSYSASFPTPTIGSLHKRYSLPKNATCELLLAVCASSVNPSDLHPSIAAADYPKVYGSDVAGRVVNTSGACSRLEIGDLVWGDIGANAHLLSSGAKTKELGGYAAYAVALEAQLSKVPSNIGCAEAGSLGKVALTSYKALRWYGGAPFAPNASVLVLGGSGGTGATGIQLSKAYGAARVTTTTSAANADFVRSLGANSVIDYHSQNWWEVLADGQFDAIYDTVGEAGTGARAIRKLRDGGRYVTITGALAPSVPPGKHQAMFINSDTNLGSAPLLDELSALIAADKLRMRRIDSTFGLSKVSDAFARSATGHAVGKISIDVGS